MTCCVMGLGYIGLPTAALLARKGHEVLGVDVRPEMLDLASRIECAEPGVAGLISEALDSGRLRTGTSVEQADAFLVCVPTPHDAVHSEAALDDVRGACEAIGAVLRPGDLVVIESTVPPGTTRKVVRPLLESRSGLRAGADFFLAFCPERARPGNLLHELVHVDRVVGGIDGESTRRAAAVYRTFIEGDVFETDCDTAEMTKLFENTYVAVNIALANEMAMVAEHLGVDGLEAIRLANHHPRVRILNPGPGVGGHCIPVDPWFLVESAPGITATIKAALLTNEYMPIHVAHTTILALRRAGKKVSRTRVVLLGVTYKGDVADTRASPATAIAKVLEAANVTVTFHDPVVTEYERPVERDLVTAARGADALVVVTDHSGYRNLPQMLNLLKGVMAFHPVLIDARGIVASAPGFEMWRIGAGMVGSADAGPVASEPRLVKGIS